jgi:hypothetical protein
VQEAVEALLAVLAVQVVVEAMLVVALVVLELQTLVAVVQVDGLMILVLIQQAVAQAVQVL